MPDYLVCCVCDRYQSALAHRDVTVLTPPYIDTLGNGIVLSLCRALYRSRFVLADSKARHYQFYDLQCFLKKVYTNQ